MYKNYLVSKPDKKSTKKSVFKWIKLVFYLFILISMLWGCAQMFVSKFQSFQIKDLTGDKVFRPGVFFEILVGQTSQQGKSHFFNLDDKGDLYEYSYLAISNWVEAFTKTVSPFYGCFVYPTAWLLTILMNAFGGLESGVAVLFSIMLTAFIVRFFTLLLSWNAQKNQEKMQLVQVKQADIQAKYKNSNDPMAKQRQQMEIMNLYKKENINPLATIMTGFLSAPFLFAVYTVVRSVRQLRVASIGQINLIENPAEMIKQGEWIYLSLLAVYLPTQSVSVLLPMLLNTKATKKANADQKRAKRKQLIMQIVFIFVFFFISLTVASGVTIYWIFAGLWTIGQTLAFHFLKLRRKSKIKVKKSSQFAVKEPWFKRWFKFKKKSKKEGKSDLPNLFQQQSDLQNTDKIILKPKVSKQSRKERKNNKQTNQNKKKDKISLFPNNKIKNVKNKK